MVLERALLLMEQWAKENPKEAHLGRMSVAEMMTNLGMAHFYEGRFEEGAAIQHWVGLGLARQTITRA